VVAFLASNCPYPFEVIIAENGSDDQTRDLALRLEEQHNALNVISLPQKGRGRAVKEAWRQSKAEILTYMDVDLSTDLSAFVPLIRALQEDGYDLAIGTRFARGASRKRGIKREILSVGYNVLVRAILGAHFSDAQCGFKAIARRTALELLPLVKDNHWFMDTELLVLAEVLGYNICEIPVSWVDDPDSRVEIWDTVLQDIKGLVRLRREIRQFKHADSKSRTI
jgi:glycosyltransferase involved in cell wall biosynthesis